VHSAVDIPYVTPPRPIIPGQTIMVTVEAVARSFRFLPSPKVVETIRYCFFASLQGFRIDVHEFCWLSNHFHIVMTPHEADLPDFMKKFNSLLARALNALRGTKGTNIEDHYNVTVEVDEEAIWRQCAYTLANPCAAHLVSKARHWRGPNSYKLEYGQELVVKRPKFGLWKAPDAPPARKKNGRRHPWDKSRRSYRGRWTSPETVAFKLVRPPVAVGVLSDKQVRTRMRELTEQREQAADAVRKRSRRKVLGMRRVLKQAWWHMPRTTQDLFGPEPKVAASSTWARREAAQRSREFQDDYRVALEKWTAGEREVVFPWGTFLMRRRFDVCCAPAPPG
jgi:REP element-mobilizing transposase RayT